MKINITGQWRREEDKVGGISVHEKWPQEMYPNTFDGISSYFHEHKEPDFAPVIFLQSLLLPKGKYSLILEYDSAQDKARGYSIHQKYVDFQGLSVNQSETSLRFISDEGILRAEHFFEAEGETRFALKLHNTRPMQTFIEGEFESGIYEAVGAEGGEYSLAGSVPFRNVPFIGRTFTPYTRGIVPPEGIWGIKPDVYLDCGGKCAKNVYFLGMTHFFDIANGSWYAPKGDHGYSHFVGDLAGNIELHFQDGEIIQIPLIFGYNIWYCRPQDILWHNDMDQHHFGGNYDALIYKGMDEKRSIIRESLALEDALKPMGALSHNMRYIYGINLPGKALDGIVVRKSEQMYGYPVISGITLEVEKGNLPHLAKECITAKPMAGITEKRYVESIERLKHSLYQYANEVPELQEAAFPEGYSGPLFDFKGCQQAVRAATYLHYNIIEVAAHIAATGTNCSSSLQQRNLFQSYCFGTGIWIETGALYKNSKNFLEKYFEHEHLPGTGSAWTRGIGELLREATCFGYDKFGEQYVSWYENCMFHEALPPHMNRIAGEPSHAYQETISQGLIEKGCRENDGHGICMWGRFMLWHKNGRDKDFARRHYKAVKASVAWIEWMLEHDIKDGLAQLHRDRGGEDEVFWNGPRADVILNCSESGRNTYEIYSNYNCLHGIKMSAKIAAALEEREDEKRFLVLWARLRRGIVKELCEQSEFGPIWHTEKPNQWADYAQGMVHIQLAPDGETFTPLEDAAKGDELDKQYLAISQNTYRHLMKEKNYNCLRMYGYGQGFMAQSALLLDEMEDAEHFLELLLGCCYLEELGKWTSPEGIILHQSGEYYLPVNGYLGQDSHLADSLKAIRLMIGIDDNRLTHLRLVPRYPANYSSMCVKNMPFAFEGGKGEISYHYTRKENNHIFAYEITGEIEQISVRIGPIKGAKANAYFGGKSLPCRCISSGDSWWVWIENMKEKAGTILVEPTL